MKRGRSLLPLNKTLSPVTLFKLPCTVGGIWGSYVTLFCTTCKGGPDSLLVTTTASSHPPTPPAFAVTKLRHVRPKRRGGVYGHQIRLVTAPIWVHRYGGYGLHVFVHLASLVAHNVAHSADLNLLVLAPVVPTPLLSRKPPLCLPSFVTRCALRTGSLAGKPSTAVSVTSDTRGKHHTLHGNHNTPWVFQRMIPALLCPSIIVIWDGICYVRVIMAHAIPFATG